MSDREPRARPQASRRGECPRPDLTGRAASLALRLVDPATDSASDTGVAAPTGPTWFRRNVESVGSLGSGQLTRAEPLALNWAGAAVGGASSRHHRADRAPPLDTRPQRHVSQTRLRTTRARGCPCDPLPAPQAILPRSRGPALREATWTSPSAQTWASGVLHLASAGGPLTRPTPKSTLTQMLHFT